jgi:hypothetical protein
MYKETVTTQQLKIKLYLAANYTYEHDTATSTLGSKGLCVQNSSFLTFCMRDCKGNVASPPLDTALKQERTSTASLYRLHVAMKIIDMIFIISFE